MISPFILRRAKTEAGAEFLRVFLKEYFLICQRQTEDSAERTLLVHCDMIRDFRDDDWRNVPVFVRQGRGGCDVVNDPLLPFTPKYDRLRPLVAEQDEIPLRRLKYLFDRFDRPTEDDSVIQTTIASLRGWYQRVSFEESGCVLLEGETDGRKGVVDPYDKVIVPFLYENITPLPIFSDHISLFVCRKAGRFSNNVDVYDPDGHRIFENIGGLYRYEDDVRYHFSPESGNRPAIRFAEKLRLIMYQGISPDDKTPPPYKEYIRPVSDFRLLPQEEGDDGPKRLHRFSDCNSLVKETDVFDLQEMQDLLFPMAERIAAYYGDAPEEVLLSIPFWNFFHLSHQKIDGLTPESVLIDTDELSAAASALVSLLNLGTAADIAAMDVKAVCGDNEDLEWELSIVQMRVRYTLKQE